MREVKEAPQPPLFFGEREMGLSLVYLIPEGVGRRDDGVMEGSKQKWEGDSGVWLGEGGNGKLLSDHQIVH